MAGPKQHPEASNEYPQDTYQKILDPMGNDMFGNMDSLMKEKGFPGFTDIQVLFQDGKIGNDVQLIFKLNGKDITLPVVPYKDIISQLSNNLNKPNIPSHEHVGIANYLIEYTKRVERIKRSTRKKLAALLDTIDTQTT